MKCEVCNNKIDETFLNKIVGTIIKDDKGKKHNICSNCQKEYNNNKDEILKNINK
jgi:hypothetical protein